MVIINYDKKWPQDFLKIKAELQKMLTIPCKMQHVGSTSIPGMKAKPIIDIDVGLENWSDFEAVKRALAESAMSMKETGELPGVKLLEEVARYITKSLIL